MSKLTDILRLYTTGDASADEVNKKLTENGFGGFKLNPNRGNLTKEQIADGWGLLYTGTGYPDPAQMKDGELVNADCGNMKAEFFQNGKRYTVDGKKLIESGE